MDKPGLSECRLGRDPENDIVVDSPVVSGRHARIGWDSATDTAWIEDLGSANGTSVGTPGRRSGRLRFSASDTIFLGSQAVSGASLIARLRPTYDATLKFDTDRMVIGRDRGCDRVIDAPQVSSRHACLTRTPTGVLIADLGSANGTSVNRQPIQVPTAVIDGDVIGLGTVSLTLRIAPGLGAPLAMRAPIAPTLTLDDEDSHNEIVVTRNQLWLTLALLGQSLLLSLLILIPNVAAQDGNAKIAAIDLALAIASIWFGLSASVADGVIKRFGTEAERQSTPANWLVAIVLTSFCCVVQCLLAWLIVSSAADLKASAVSIALMCLAGSVGLALGFLITAVTTEPVPAITSAIVAILLMAALTAGPIAGLMPSRWAFESLVQLEADARPPDAKPVEYAFTSPAGRRACAYALGLMLVGLTVAAAIITSGPASRPKSSQLDPAVL